MNINDREALEAAKKRMEGNRKERALRRKSVKDVKEPDHLISGSFDEVSITREEKNGENDD